MQVAADADHAAFSSAPRSWAISRTRSWLDAPSRRGRLRREASDAAAAVCNLGLENWPSTLAEDFLAGHDLISVFQVGWTVLHRDVCMYAAERLIDVLAQLRCDDREIQAGLDALRIELARQCATARRGAPARRWMSS